MSYWLIQDSTLSSIADAIRTKTGKSEAFSPSQMVSEILNIPSGGNDELFNQLVERTISGSLELNNSTIGNNAFTRCYSLTTISLPNCLFLGSHAFYECFSLTTISLPNCEYISNNAFYSCSKLTTVSLPNCLYIDSYAFAYCASLTTVSLPNCSIIGNYAFRYCSKLTSFYILTSNIPTLSGFSAFASTPLSLSSYLGNKYGSIYVKSSLLTSFKTATNWSVYSNRIVGI